MKIVKKEIKFHGDQILTVQDYEKIYVSVKHVCFALEMNEIHYKTQKRKLNNDEMLKEQIRN